MPVKKALLIGIQYDESSPDWCALPGTMQDVAKLRDLLISHFGYRTEDILVMTDDVGVAPHLKPTKTNLLREIRTFTVGAQDGDHFLFYFAGHSDQIICKHGSEDDGADGILVCADHRRIKDNKLHKKLVNPLPNGASLTAIFDSCNSGTLLDLEHYACNSVWVPWVNKGERRSDTLRNRIDRKCAFCQEHATSRERAVLIPHPDLSPKMEGVTELDLELRLSLMSSSPTPTLSTTWTQTTLDTSVLIEVTMETFQPELRSIGEMLDTNTDKSIPARSALGTSICTSSLPAFDDDYLWDKDIRTQSPVSMFPRYCGGYCRDRLGGVVADHPLVVSISASRDGQTAWGDKEDSMTLSLIKILKETPTPSFHHMMTQLNHHIHDSTMEMHKYAMKMRRQNRRRGSSPSCENQIEMNNFQEPQLGSITPLKMDDPFTL